LFLEEFLKSEIFNIKVAVFHSDLTLLSRDRQAAYFADPEGAQILLCTEIGSEGRNFQFAQDLVLYDLPVSPDLLEQRIGRLDRIGQKGDIFIHVPYIKNSEEEGVFDWLQLGLGAFEKPLKLTYSFFNSIKDQLFSFLDHYPKDKDKFKKFLEEVRTQKSLIEKEIDQGRDKLIELNSFNEKKGQEIVLDILKFDENNDLKSFMEEVFHNFGVDFEDLDERGEDYFIKPGSNMFVPHFPELPNDGMRVTFLRERALEREEITFLTWDHPMVVGILDLILGGEFGNVSMRLRKKRKKEAIYLECHFWLECMAPKKLDAERFFPPTSFRTLVDLKGQDFEDKWSPQFIEENTNELKGDLVQRAIPVLRRNIPSLILASEEKVQPMVRDYILQKTKEMKLICDSEISRLLHMKARKLSVREEEIVAHKKLKDVLENSFENAKMRLDSVRVIF
jgi:ATP-dependent helicase HepA